MRRIRVTFPEISDTDLDSVHADIKALLAQRGLKADLHLVEFATGDEWEAASELTTDGEIELDDDAEISRGDDAGFYIQAWLWVPQDEENA